MSGKAALAGWPLLALALAERAVEWLDRTRDAADWQSVANACQQSQVALHQVIARLVE